MVWVADPVGCISDPTFEKNPDRNPDPTFEKKTGSESGSDLQEKTDPNPI